jgi:hypothetical protein
MRPIRLFAGLSALALLAAPVLAQTVWKWKDKDGVVHYSDQPAPGAERIELRAQSNAPAVSSTAASSSARSTATPAAPPSYTNFEIWKPSQDATLTGTRGQISVGVRVEPALAAAHTIWLYLDGRRLDGLPPKAAEYELMDVKNGQHTLVGIITDGQGKQVISTQSVTFQVQ